MVRHIKILVGHKLLYIFCTDKFLGKIKMELTDFNLFIVVFFFVDKKLRTVFTNENV